MSYLADEEAPSGAHDPDMGDNRRGNPGRVSSKRRVGSAVAAVILLASLGAVWVLRDPTTDGPPTAALAFSFGDTSVSEDDVAARVEVLQVLYGLQVPESASALADFRRDTARTFAATLLISAEARSRGVSADPSDVRDALRRYIEQRYGLGGDAEFRSDLQDAGVSEEDVLREITLQLDGQALFDLVTKGVAVTVSEVRTAYEADPGAWAVPARRRLRAIVVADRVAATRVLAAQRNGADFASLARQHSLDGATRDLGGELGVLSRTQLDADFGAAAFRAGAGDVFGPVGTAKGWYVGQVERVLPPLTTLAQVRPQVEDALVADRSLFTWNAHVAELLERADIDYAAAYEPEPGDDLDVITPDGRQ
jgi:peptidyl-prolyl cis-trans isomerase C